MSTDPGKFLNCDPWIAQVLARDIDARRSDAVNYVGPNFADFQGREIARQINEGKGDAEALCQQLIIPELASALASAINEASERGS